MRAHAGNYSLFISGIFHENTQRRSLRGGRDLKFYEQIGRTNDQMVASPATARCCERNDAYGEVADRFRAVRLALNQLSDHLLNLDDDVPFHPPVLETLFSQIQKLFERTYAQVGINLEDCLIDQRRCKQLTKLAGASLSVAPFLLPRQRLPRTR